MAITIKDIAKIAGVSHTTVSRALNDSPLISDATRQRINKIAREHKYVVNTSAKSLKMNRAFTIGIFFSHLKEGTNASFFQKALLGASDALAKHYNIVVRETHNFQQYNDINKQTFDGILLISQREEDYDFIQVVKAAGLPIVLVNRDFQDTSFCTFLSDERKGSRQATRFLIDKGHKRIATITGKSDFKNTHLRLEGYREALERAGQAFDKSLVANGEFTYAGGYEAMKTLLKLKKRPTAVFCQNDEMAIGAMKAVVEAGLSVPDHIALMGYDEIEMSQFMQPALTTVSRHLYGITKRAMVHLIKFIEGEAHDPQVYYIASELKIRKSV